jgi:hypothetical protein
MAVNMTSTSAPCGLGAVGEGAMTPWPLVGVLHTGSKLATGAQLASSSGDIMAAAGCRAAAPRRPPPPNAAAAACKAPSRSLFYRFRRPLLPPQAPERGAQRRAAPGAARRSAPARAGAAAATRSTRAGARAGGVPPAEGLSPAPAAPRRRASPVAVALAAAARPAKLRGRRVRRGAAAGMADDEEQTLDERRALRGDYRKLAQRAIGARRGARRGAAACGGAVRRRARCRSAALTAGWPSPGVAALRGADEADEMCKPNGLLSKTLDVVDRLHQNGARRGARRRPPTAKGCQSGVPSRRRRTPPPAAAAARRRRAAPTARSRRACAPQRRAGPRRRADARSAPAVFVRLFARLRPPSPPRAPQCTSRASRRWTRS